MGSAAAPLVAFAFALIVLIWVMLRVIQRSMNRRRDGTPQQQVDKVKVEMDRKDSRGDRRLKDAPPDVLRWQVEMHETARDLMAELNTKIAIVNSACRLAEVKLRELKSEIQRLEQLQVSLAPAVHSTGKLDSDLASTSHTDSATAPTVEASE